MPDNYYQDDFIHLYVEDGIIYAKHPDDIEVNLEMAINNVKQRLILANGQDYPMLIDVSNIKNFTKEAQEYVSSDIALKGIVAGAFIVKNQFMKFMGSIFIHLNLVRTTVPTKLFMDEESAKEWIQQYATITSAAALSA